MVQPFSTAAGPAAVVVGIESEKLLVTLDVAPAIGAFSLHLFILLLRLLLCHACACVLEEEAKGWQQRIQDNCSNCFPGPFPRTISLSLCKRTDSSDPFKSCIDLQKQSSNCANAEF